MPTTFTVNDPRARTNSIVIDLSDPMQYKLVITREMVREVAETGEIYSREMGAKIIETVDFDLAGNPSGDPILLSLIGPIQQAVFDLVAKYNAT